MGRDRDADTPDLFAVAPPRVVARFEEVDVQAATASERIARGVSKVLRDCGTPRAEVAKAMSYLLQERVSEAMLNAYASQARCETHAIPAHRLVALAAVTGDERLLNLLLADTEFIVVDAKFEPLIKREMAKEVRARLDREIAEHDAEWKRSFAGTSR